ncbi:MAG: rolling circle replication-associated protein, partial [Nocardioides sp.]
MQEWDVRRAISALDISNEFHLKPKDKIRGGWGKLSQPTTFGKNARHRLLESGAIIDKECGLNAWEITCTIPGNTRAAFRTVAEHTGWIMNELTREIRRAKCQLWFYVWELQKRGALHLHLCVADPSMDLSSLASRLESRWWELLQSLCTRTETDVFAKSSKKTWRFTPAVWRSHIAPIKKSVAAYFSKYAGKTALPTSSPKTSNRVYTPSRWWGCSR